jgi:NAD(P)-dependent dehydrogenase (short-subunit alcohol dehydrogenase family)
MSPNAALDPAAPSTPSTPPSVALPPDALLLITGGSRGIGAATARLAAAAGWALVLNYRSDARAAEALVAELRATGARAWALPADVADEAQVVGLFEAVDALARAHGLSLRGVAHSAGVVDRAQRVDEMDGARLRRMVGINLLGSLYVAREAVRRLSTRHGGAGGALVLLS